MTTESTMRPAKDDLPVQADAAYYVHYRERDSQGGFWTVTPKGPYDNLNKARQVASRLRGQPHRYRGVRLVLRTEVELSIIGGTWPI